MDNLWMLLLLLLLLHVCSHGASHRRWKGWVGGRARVSGSWTPRGSGRA